MHNPFDAGYYCSEELLGFGFRSIGENVRIAKTCNIVGLNNISIGSDVRIDAHCQIIACGGPVTLGSYIHIGGGCFLSGRGGISMGDFSGLSQNVAIYSATDDYLGGAMTNPMVPEHLTNVKIAPVAIGRHAIIGSGAVVLPGADLAEGAAVGALSLVTRPIGAWELHAGAPAGLVRKRLRNPLVLERELHKRMAA